VPEVRAAPSSEVRAAVSAAHREEWARVFGALVRFTGDWSLAEDCTQDAYARALERWTEDGIPRSPGAWLTVAARRRAIDLLRRSGVESQKIRLAMADAELVGEAADATLEDDAEWEDDVLRLVYTCAHPALPLDGRVALTLRTVAGLTTREIARLFLVNEATMSQRLLRTKRKIAEAGIPYRVPPPELASERTAGVLSVVYLVFTEGYAPEDGRPVRDELCVEGIRLARLVHRLTGDAEARGLLALLLLQHARRTARLDAAGELVPLDEQDRSLWDVAAISEGIGLLAAGPLASARSTRCCRRPPSSPSTRRWRSPWRRERMRASQPSTPLASRPCSRARRCCRRPGASCCAGPDATSRR
jgi:RNA polymerase sigma-70 factor (ECF subfamily)